MSTITTTQLDMESSVFNDTLLGSEVGFPSKLDESFITNFPKLSDEQAGHLRHFHNLSSQRDGIWQHMGTQEPGQEWLDAYRYQLATMFYASAVTHYHRLPILRSTFRSLMLQLIHKMLLRDVWGYWFLASHSGTFVDPDIKELRKPWPDPIAKENIMYSGHLLLMVSLYTMLFDDDRFNEKGALTFNWNPLFWGLGPETFSYTRQTLQATILRDMEREKWLGACCEPNNIFIVCNQFPLVALRYNDLRDNTRVSPEVLAKYTAAWKAKGMVQDNGLFFSWLFKRQDRKQPARGIGGTAWTSAYMNAWNPVLTRATFDKVAIGYLAKINEREVIPTDHRVAAEIRELVKTEDADAMDPATYYRARNIVSAKKWPPEFRMPYRSPDFGYVMQWVSELGDQPTLDGLLCHADAAFNPTWDRGGLFYAPQDSDDTPERPFVDVFTGNAGIAYGRLNVSDGQRKMYEKPWTSEHFSSSPFVEDIDLSSAVDFLRGSWDEQLQALAVTMRSWDGQTKRVRPRVLGLDKGSYGIYENGNLVQTHVISSRWESIQLDLEISGQETDVVILRGK